MLAQLRQICREPAPETLLLDEALVNLRKLDMRLKDLSVRNETLFFFPIFSLSLLASYIVTASCTPFLPFSGGSVFGCLRFTLLLPLCTVLVEAENISVANHPTSEAPQTFIRKDFYDMHSFLRKCCSDLQCMQCRTGGSSKDWVGVVLKGKSPAKPRAG